MPVPSVRGEKRSEIHRKEPVKVEELRNVNPSQSITPNVRDKADFKSESGCNFKSVLSCLRYN